MGRHIITKDVLEYNNDVAFDDDNAGRVP